MQLIHKCLFFIFYFICFDLLKSYLSWKMFDYFWLLFLYIWVFIYYILDIFCFVKNRDVE